MAYNTAEARGEMLDAIAAQVGQIALALACLGEAHEQLDDDSADRLEQQLFRPVQLAFGRAQRTHATFAERHGLPRRAFEQAGCGAPAHGAKPHIDRAAAVAAGAGQAIATLQDSMMPVEVGDAELRAGLAEVRDLLDGVGPAARAFLRTLGR